MFSFVGDTVLDPFMGTGTTTLGALRWGRHSIGVELTRKYYELGAEAHTSGASQSLESGYRQGVMNYQARLAAAVRQFWQTRARQDARQGQTTGERDAGNRTAVTGGKHLDGFVQLVQAVLMESGLLGVRSTRESAMSSSQGSSGPRRNGI